jgi:hypothetical protein
MMQGTMRMASLYTKLTHSKETNDSKKPDAFTHRAREKNDILYFTVYLTGLKNFLHKESRTLTTLQYFKIAEEIELIKTHIKNLEL